MSRTVIVSRKVRQAEAQRKKRQQKIIVTAVLVVGLLLLGWGIYAAIANRQVNQTALAYSAADVVYDQPIQAVHDMGEGPPIPFLPRNQPQPAILVPEKNYNFGNIGPKDIVEHTFLIRNTGEAPLTISRAYTTCGCTTAEISASVIPPGKVAEIRLVFDAGFHDAGGQTVRRGLIIENNDPQQSQTEIWIQATVRNS